MTSTVSNTKIQTSHYRPYRPGAKVCKCSTAAPSLLITCDDSDWHYDDEPCCMGFGGIQHLCSRLDPGVCPIIAGGARAEWATTGNANLEQSKKVKCTYNISGFVTADDVQRWINNWGKDNQYNNDIMPSFCNLPSTNCPIGESTCTNITATDKSGDLCRNWLAERRLLPTQPVIPISSLFTPFPTRNWWQRNNWWVLILIAVGILLIFIIIIIIVNSTRNRRALRESKKRISPPVPVQPRTVPPVTTPSQPVHQQPIPSQPSFQQTTLPQVNTAPTSHLS